MEFATNLREVRVTRAMSQKELGERTGLQQSQINHYEADRRSPSMANLILLATTLGCSTDRLLGLCDSNEWDAGYHVGLETARNTLNALLSPVPLSPDE